MREQSIALPAGNVNEQAFACVCDADCVCARVCVCEKRGRIAGWTPGPERQRRFEGQHQTVQQLINACRGDPELSTEQHKHIKNASQSPPS